MLRAFPLPTISTQFGMSTDGKICGLASFNIRRRVFTLIPDCT
jgi:hypothetical protein